MATIQHDHNPKAARVDRLVDENGATIDVPENSALEADDRVERTVGSTGPTAWWRYGLIGLAIVVAIILALQLMGGGASTEMVPGTPTTEQQPAV